MSYTLKSFSKWIIAAGIFGSVTFVFSCNNKDEKPLESASIHFTSLPSSYTKVAFNNKIVEDDTVNLIYDAYAYMGAGVGIGDFNNDGLPDIFFGANQESGRLFVNKGNFVFEDITVGAGLTTDKWITGVSVVDINNDGFDDIYLCASGVSGDGEKRRNLLYINDRKLGFTEQAMAYGLADTMYSTQAVFFDYDRDGDLDMYLLNHFISHQQSNNIVLPDSSGNAPARDKLYRNNGYQKKLGHPVFEDVSFTAGVIEDGFGLGVVACDVNNDQWPDIYVGNDYLANDKLWISNRNGTFTNSSQLSLRHQSYSSMGVDAGDINNDGWSDLISLDMQPDDNYRKKMMYSFMNYERYVMERKAGYEPEFVRNMLQLNNGLTPKNDTPFPYFSEIGQLAGIAETDWSWSVLLADFDNDGWKDIHITNGLGRDIINSDFIAFWASSSGTGSMNWREMYRSLLNKLNEYGVIELQNSLYRNNGNLQFSNITKSAGLFTKSISNGCAYADLNNDGFLDLVVNNINKEAFILKNDAVKDSARHYLSVILEGDTKNRNGFGANVALYAGEKILRMEQFPVRGYLSSVDKRLFFGTGDVTFVDSLKVVWPDGRMQKLEKVATDRTITLSYKDAQEIQVNQESKVPGLFTDITGSRGLIFRHHETVYNDFDIQRLLPQKYSQLGPFIATADVNGDGLNDFFVGGAAHQSGQIFLQQKDRSFVSRQLEENTKLQDDLGCIFFDADGDKDVDLFINSGGYEYSPGGTAYSPRLYLNDGSGNFKIDPEAFPKTIFTSAQCVAAADYDADGDIDLFIGGRVSPRQYPVIPQSFLLKNDGGKFSIATDIVCPALQYAGMVTSAVWTDFNNDQSPDLIIAGEWMPVRFFANQKGILKELTPANIDRIKGQWRSLTACDIDNDGDIDIIAGNLGLNNKYKSSQETPVRMFATDIDNNGSVDPVMAYWMPDQKGKLQLFPAIGRDQLAAQVPAIKNQYLYHVDYARADIDAILPDKNDEMLQFSCTETATGWFENKGNGEFIWHQLPVEAQFAPVNAIVCRDFNNDGKIDLLTAGNEYQSEVVTGRYDASYGVLLAGDGKGNFQAIPASKTGIVLDGDIKDLKTISLPGESLLLVAAENDGALQVYLK